MTTDKSPKRKNGSHQVLVGFGGSREIKRRNNNIYHIVFDCVKNQLTYRVQVQLSHDVAAMGFGGFDTQVEITGYFFR